MADQLYPIPGATNTVSLPALLARTPAIRNVEVGDYSYYSDFNDPLAFFERNLRYNFGFSGARLVLGKFCQLAHGTSFVFPDANHASAGISTYPFAVLGGAWAEALPLDQYPFPTKGDTVVGSDVWFGYESLVMPGISIGSGAIIAARAVVTRDVPPYAIVAGNPATVVRMRFAPERVEELLAMAWWEWPEAEIRARLPDLVLGSAAGLNRPAGPGRRIVPPIV